jgi:hypothetical protein
MVKQSYEFTCHDMNGLSYFVLYLPLYTQTVAPVLLIILRRAPAKSGSSIAVSAIGLPSG